MVRLQITNTPSRGQTVFKKHLFTFIAAEKKSIKIHHSFLKKLLIN